MRVRHFVPLLVAASLAGCSRPAVQAAKPAATSGQVVAVVDGQDITLADVDQRAVGALRRLRHDEFEVRRRTLDDLVAERLVDEEAKRRGVTREQLLQAEVEGKVGEPTREEVAALVEQHKARLVGRTPEQAAADVSGAVRRQRVAERKEAFHDELRAKANVRVTLEEPRVEIALPADAPTLGPAQAPVTLVEFLDYQCGYCRRAQSILDQVMQEYQGRVRFVQRDFLIGNPASWPAARAVRCAADQGHFWAFHRSLLLEAGALDASDLSRRARSMGMDESHFATCAASKRFDESIERSMQAGDDLGVSGTPTFFLNGRRLTGMRTLEDFRRAIDQELASRS